MAEASDEKTLSAKKNWLDLIKRIFRLIVFPDLDDLKEIFKILQSEQRIKVLNYTVDGCSPLYLAVKYSRVEICRYLLELSLRLQGPHAMSEQWKSCRHPLTPAIKIGNPILIGLILEHLSNINDNIDGARSPLLIATSLGNLGAVEQIVEKGADINRPCFQGKSVLMYSTANWKICSYLLAHGANVHHQDEYGFTALHLATRNSHIESVMQLVNAGADVMSRNYEGITPLNMASILMCYPVLKCLIQQPGCSLLDKIEVLEILNVGYIFTKCPFMIPWKESLRLRAQANLPKNCQIPTNAVDYIKEFTTETELENLQGNLLHRALQSSLVIKRIIGTNNHLYMECVLLTALIAKQENDMKKLRQLLHYMKVYCHETSFFFVPGNIYYFKGLFSEISTTSNQNDLFEYAAFDIFKMAAQAVLYKWKRVKDNIYSNPFIVDDDYLVSVDALLDMILSPMSKKFSRYYLGQFRELITTLVGEDIRLKFKRSLLHHIIKLMKQPYLKWIWLIKLFLQCGADANSRDCYLRTPLMYAVINLSPNAASVVQKLLIQYGCDPSCRNREGLTAL